jgi:hypothetical protein
LFRSACSRACYFILGLSIVGYHAKVLCHLLEF